MCRWKRHKREGRLEFEVHSEWMRRTRRIGQMRPADAEGSKVRQGAWVLGPGSSPFSPAGARQPVAPWEWAGGKVGRVGRLGIRWGHLDQSNTMSGCVCTSVPGHLEMLRRVGSGSMMRCHSTSLHDLIESITAN